MRSGDGGGGGCMQVCRRRAESRLRGGDDPVAEDPRPHRPAHEQLLRRQEKRAEGATMSVTTAQPFEPEQKRKQNRRSTPTDRHTARGVATRLKCLAVHFWREGRLCDLTLPQ